MQYRENYIKYVNSGIMNPSDFDSLNDFIDYCNITCILAFDFLDIELTKQICEKKWVNHFKNQKLLLSSH
jgi:hypothetical protein